MFTGLVMLFKRRRSTVSMKRSRKRLIPVIIAACIFAVLWAGSIFLLHNSYMNSPVRQLQIKDGAIVTDKDGNAVRMTFWQEKGVSILLCSVVFVGGGLFASIKAAGRQ
jgi:hypothetical protein